MISTIIHSWSLFSTSLYPMFRSIHTFCIFLRKFLGKFGFYSTIYFCYNIFNNTIFSSIQTYHYSSFFFQLKISTSFVLGFLTLFIGEEISSWPSAYRASDDWWDKRYLSHHIFPSFMVTVGVSISVNH